MTKEKKRGRIPVHETHVPQPRHWRARDVRRESCLRDASGWSACRRHLGEADPHGQGCATTRRARQQPAETKSAKAKTNKTRFVLFTSTHLTGTKTRPLAGGSVRAHMPECFLPFGGGCHAALAALADRRGKKCDAARVVQQGSNIVSCRKILSLFLNINSRESG